MIDELVLSEEECIDLRALLSWAFVSKSGIPQTAVLTGLWGRLVERDREREAS